MVTGVDADEEQVSLDELRSERKKLEQELQQVEQQLYNFEGSYLEDTWSTGNVIKGFEGYISNKNKKGGEAFGVGRKTKFKETERIFSYSSESSVRVCALFTFHDI
jgi:chromatin modification-related protein EAF6